MHTASHPEYKEESNGKPTSVDPVLRGQLTAMRDLPGWSNNKLAKAIGCNPAYVQGYIGDEFPANVQQFERKLVDFFANESRRRASGVETIESAAALQIKTACELIRKTNDLGAVVAPSGEGKTRGIELYVENNPTTILSRTAIWSSDKKAVEANMFAAVGRDGWDKQTRYATFMVNKLRGSNRLILVDDAHKLSRPALQWFVDFHDATQCPIGLFGTLALLDKLEDDTQRFSRTGYYEEIKHVDSAGDLIVDRALIKSLVKQLAPDANGETETLCDLSEQVAAEHGHYRSVHKQLKLAAEIKSGAKTLSWPQAFRAAHTKLIRNFKLS
jgi:hypothetical protein